MKKKLTFIDLFAGCGGLSEGFMQSGRFEGLAHVEWELPMVNTLRNRLVKSWGHSEDDAEKRVVHFDIQKSAELLDGKWSSESKKTFENTNHADVVANGLKGLCEGKKVDLIVGGPPCQAYSIAGRAQDSNSMKNDYRNYLFESFVAVVRAFQPEVFVFENVPGMLSACPGDIPVTERIHAAFSESGYTIKKPEELQNVVYSADKLGVPQKRRRVIIVGVKKGGIYDLQDIYNSIDLQKSNSEPYTVKNAIGHLPGMYPVQNGKETGKNSHSDPGNAVKHHHPRFHNQRDISIFRKWITENMNEMPQQEKIEFYNRLMNKRARHAKYRNLVWDRPSPTIVAHLYKDGLMFIHPDAEQARTITVKEAALLQSFPDDFEFLGGQGYCYKMIGNAVPVRMAEKIATGIAGYIENPKTILHENTRSL